MFVTRLHRHLGTLSLSLLLTATAHAEIVGGTWYTAASTLAATCRSSSLSCASYTTPTVLGDNSVAVSGVSASSAVTANQGSAEAHAIIDGRNGLNLAHLSGQAQSSSGGHVVAAAYAGDRLTYTGDDDATRTLEVALSASSVTDSPTRYARAQAMVFIVDEADALDVFGSSDFNFSDLWSALLDDAIDALAQTTLTLRDAGTVTDQLSLDLTDGQHLLMLSSFQLNAGNGAEAVSMHSLGMAFDDNTGLSTDSPFVQAGNVPEPASLALVLLALGGAAVTRRRTA